MASLLYKEFLTQRTVILIYLVVTLLDINIFRVDDFLFYLFIPSFFAIFFTMNTVTLDDRNKSHILLNSLPVSRKEVVTAKFLFAFLFGSLLIGITLIYQTVIRPSLPENGLLQAVIAVAAISWFASIFFPMYYWLGPSFARIGTYVVFVLAFAVAPMVYNLGKKHNFWGIVDLLQSAPTYILVALLFGLTLSILLISWFLSVRLYERKEF